MVFGSLCRKRIIAVMSNRSDSDVDDDFRDLYKEYTGPPGSATVNAQDKAKTTKRPHSGSDEDDEPRDPNTVPTDFTSREAKVWEAKSKATERNWKKKKEEEMICKICGESGHFTQVSFVLMQIFLAIILPVSCLVCILVFLG